MARAVTYFTDSPGFGGAEQVLLTLIAGSRMCGTPAENALIASRHQARSPQPTASFQLLVDPGRQCVRSGRPASTA